MADSAVPATAELPEVAPLRSTADETPEIGEWIEPAQPSIVPATDLGSVLTLKHGTLFLLTDHFGDIHPDTRGLGLYRGDTRILSCASVRLNGTRLALLQAPAGATYQGAIEMTNPGPRDVHEKIQPEADVELARRTLGVRRERLLAGALRERLRIVNHAEHPAPVEVELEFGNDGADIFEVRGYPRPERGLLRAIAADASGRRIAFRYDGLDGVRRTTHVAFSEAAVVRPSGSEGEGEAPAGSQVAVRWRFTLEPGVERTVEWRVWDEARPIPAGLEADVETTDLAAGDGAADLFPSAPPVRGDEAAAAYHAWTRGTTAVESDHELFNLTIRRSVADLRLLVNDGPDPGERYVAAGVPWFATLFGRDAIIISLQSLAFRPQIAIETLGVLAARQATAIDDWRDAEPGKILHELRTGEMARAGELPFTPYYGSIDSTPLWLVLLGATFDWTGDRALLDRFWPNAMAALEWIDRYGDRDGDLFVEYARRSERGLVNQGWKDSADAVRDRRGRLVDAPIALVEVQGYVYEAKRRMSHLATVRGDNELAARLDREAEALRTKFEDSFWVDDLAYYAMALDGEKNQADAISSNPGHCLWTGIVAPDRAQHVADRLVDRGLFSGWGVRTYAAQQPGYNPIGYHTGTVWPHDTSLVAAGLKRYGFHDEANLLIGRVLEAAQQVPAFRLPELFCGFERDETSVPVPYPVACSPQGWAAAAPFLFLQTMLGLAPHADRRELELRRPELPSWLKSVRLSNLRVGEAVVDLLFHTYRGTTSAEVLRKAGDLSITIRL
jgi:glycogen debranching enzyme